MTFWFAMNGRYLGSPGSKRQSLNAMSDHVLARGELIGHYGAPESGEGC
jgi:hypothetical protein